jgi:hypothetical protein
LAWDAAHAAFFAQHGRRQRVFCASLANVFDNAVGQVWRADLFELIEQTPDLDWLLLTKRIGIRRQHDPRDPQLVGAPLQGRIRGRFCPSYARPQERADDLEIRRLARRVEDHHGEVIS